MNIKTCYIISIYFGDRRNDKMFYYYANRLSLLQKHIETLQKLNHNLSKIIFVINADPEHEQIINQAKSITPTKIKNADIEIKVRPNVGMSYAAWSDTYMENKDNYDYFIFNEDDYFFIIHDFDTILVNKFNSYPNLGYLCALTSRPLTTQQPLHAAHSSGISSNTVLSKVVEKYGELPHAKSNSYSQVEGDSQITQSHTLVKMGYDIQDLGDEYQIPFDSFNTIRPYYTNNTKYIIVPAKMIFESHPDIIPLYPSE